MLAETFTPSHIVTETFGNVQVATSFLYGMGLPEVKKEVLDEVDPHYPVIITTKAEKKVAP